MIEKSLTAPRKKKIKGQLHKLAYITDKEAKLLQKFGGQKVMTPEKIPAYPPPGERGGPGSGAEGRSPGGRDGGGGGAAAQAAASAAAAARSRAAAAATAAEIDRQNRNAEAEAAAKARAEAVSRGEGKVDVGFQEVLRKQKIAEDLKNTLDTDFLFEGKKVVAPKVIKPTIKTYERGVPFTDDLIQTVTPPKISPTYYQDRSRIGGETYGERAEAGIKRGGIGTTLKNVALGVLAPQLLAGTALAKPYNLYRQYQTAKRFIPKGVQETIKTALTRTPTTGTRTPTTGTRKINPLVASDRNGQRVKTVAERVATGQGLESGAKLLGVPNTQKAELFKRRSMVEDILRKGSYQNRDLTSGQRNTLMNYISQIDKYLVAV